MCSFSSSGNLFWKSEKLELTFTESEELLQKYILKDIQQIFDDKQRTRSKEICQGIKKKKKKNH